MNSAGSGIIPDGWMRVPDNWYTGIISRTFDYRRSLHCQLNSIWLGRLDLSQLSGKCAFTALCAHMGCTLSFLGCHNVKWRRIMDTRQLELEGSIPGDFGPWLIPWTSFSGFSCLGADIHSHLGILHPRQLSWQWCSFHTIAFPSDSWIQAAGSF